MVSFGVFLVDATGNLLLKLAGKTPGGKCVVIYYHAVSARQRPRFARQMDVLMALSVPVRPDEHDLVKPGRRGSIVTFDDGFVSALENALPELESRNIPALLFIPTGCLGSRPSWIRHAEALNYNETVMSRAQLQGLKNKALVVIGSHSVTHPNFLKLQEEEARCQFVQSKADLETILETKIELFSFPYGATNHHLTGLASAAGYRRIFTTSHIGTISDEAAAVTGRMPVDPDDWSLEFRLKLLDSYRWLPLAVNMKRKLGRFFKCA